MPVEFLCAGCSKTLRVPEKHAGKKAKCPQCQSINVVPTSNQPSESAGAERIPAMSGTTAASSLGIAASGAAPAATPPPAPVASNPYAASQPVVQNIAPSMNHAGGANLNVFNPLREAGFFISVTAWFNIIVGFICCLTILGIIQGAIMVWLGFSLKNANDALKLAYQSGNSAHLHTTTTKLATYFKITGVLTMIGAAMGALYVVFIILFVILGAAGAASGNF